MARLGELRIKPAVEAVLGLPVHSGCLNENSVPPVRQAESEGEAQSLEPARAQCATVQRPSEASSMPSRLRLSMPVTRSASASDFERESDSEFSAPLAARRTKRGPGPGSSLEVTVRGGCCRRFPGPGRLGSWAWARPRLGPVPGHVVDRRIPSRPARPGQTLGLGLDNATAAVLTGKPESRACPSHGATDPKLSKLGGMNICAFFADEFHAHNLHILAYKCI